MIFLRRLERGGSEHSFGIHVAQIAGMPKSIINRANVILKQLEADNSGVGAAGKAAVDNISVPGSGEQLSFFQLDDPVLCGARRDSRSRHKQPHADEGAEQIERHKDDCGRKIKQA